MRFLVLTICALIASSAASALPVCDDEWQQSIEEPTLAAAAVDDTEREARPETEVEILPCSVADSGAFGPACLEASAYLITQKGSVLCQVAIPDDPQAFSEPVQLEDRHGPLANTAPQFHAVSADVHLDPMSIAPPLVRSLSLGHGRGLGPHTALRVPPDVPS